MATLPDLSAELAALRAENEALKAKAAAQSTVRFKVSEKGAVSVYGLGRFPFTFYKSQFEALDKAWPALRDFVKLNNAKLATKE